MTNPFVYGEVVPAISVVERESELERLTRDLLAGQKIFLISPRRYGKSSLVRQALRAAERGGALTVEVTVSSYSSYVAFLEGYARALLGVETRLDKARAWMREMLGSVRPAVRPEPDARGRSPVGPWLPGSAAPTCAPPSSARSGFRPRVGNAAFHGWRRRYSRCPAGLPKPGGGASRSP